MRAIKFKLLYQSPDTDEPNKLFISEPYTLSYFLFGDRQIDFIDGGYLMLHEMEEKYTRWIEWIGRKDKTGWEIYEGDILHLIEEYKDGRKYDKGKWEVYWEYDCWFLKCGNMLYDNGDYYRGDDISWEGFKIIGSIYENPELLEGMR